ncbi:hypothetical protein K523DRAFT_407134 [Schizophyllum commune Tattone D]|nr:hypothetical protein K523DRAFT_407134 [Schizophyllum commune Tattone D]
MGGWGWSVTISECRSPGLSPGQRRWQTQARRPAADASETRPRHPARLSTRPPPRYQRRPRDPRLRQSQSRSCKAIASGARRRRRRPDHPRGRSVQQGKEG